MRKTSLLFALAVPVCGVLFSGCTSSGGQSALPITTALSSAQGSSSIQSRSAAAAIVSAPSGTYWSGTVSGVSANGITANCGQSNFGGWGCLPVTTTGAVISGTPVAGQYFQMWGNVANLPQITATTVNYSANPFPPTAPAAASTTPVPSVTVAPVVSVAQSSTSPATPEPAGTYWSGMVSGVSANGITANCGQSNFGGWGCLPVATRGATISGAPRVGQFFQMWGDFSNLPHITAMTINYAATKFPVTAPSPAPATAPTASATGSPNNIPPASPTNAPTTSPTVVPTVQPTVVPTAAPIAPPSGSSSTFMGFANAADYSTSFTPYAAASVWRTPISAHPVIASYSAAVVAMQFPNGRNNIAVRATESGIWDYNHPRYFAAASDPIVNLVCTEWCGSPANGGTPSQIRIPAVARPAHGGDGHFDIVQPDGTEITMWGANSTSSNWTNGATERASTIANCGSFSAGQGWLGTGPAPTAAGYCDDAGMVTAAELASGHINHALFIPGPCAVGNQYPAEYGATTDPCTSGLGPPLGGREWYDVPCATTQADSSLHPWEKAILCALNQYGGYLGDDVAGAQYFTGGVNPMLESEEPWYDYNGPNYTSPFAALASQGWYSFTIANAHPGQNGTRWVGADPWQPGDVNFAAHIHWLDPCSAQGTC